MDEILVDDVRLVPRGHVLTQLVECSPGLGGGFLGAVEGPCGLQDHRGVIRQRREQGDLISSEAAFPAVGGKQDSEDLAVREHRHAQNRHQTLGDDRGIDHFVVARLRVVAVVLNPLGCSRFGNRADQSRAGRNLQMLEFWRDRAGRLSNIQVTSDHVELGQVRDVGTHDVVCAVHQPLQQSVHVANLRKLTRTRIEDRQFVFATAQSAKFRPTGPDASRCLRDLRCANAEFGQYLFDVFVTDSVGCHVEQRGNHVGY